VGHVPDVIERKVDPEAVPVEEQEPGRQKDRQRRIAPSKPRHPNMLTSADRETWR
jgi:hypothetical protein